VDAERRNVRKALPWLLPLYFLVVGVFLLMAPWSRVWSSMALAGVDTVLGEMMDNPYLRGGLSGLGAFMVLVALVDLLRGGTRRGD
jgi:hypothetical protein